MATEKFFHCLNYYLLIAALTHFPVFPFDNPKNRKKCFSDVLGGVEKQNCENVVKVLFLRNNWFRTLLECL